MNSLERYLGVVRGEGVDFLPRLPILMLFAAEHLGAEYGSFAADHRVLVEANRRMAADFGLDQMNTMSDPYRETQGFGAQIVYVRDGVPRCPHPPLAEHKGLAALGRPDPYRSERMRDRLEAVRAYREACGGRCSIMGALVRLHICGDITHLLPGIADLGIDIADVDHMVDMVQARRVLGSRVALTGNIDPASGVFFGEPAVIRQAVLRTYAEVGNPYMVNAGCEIPPGTPPANLKALCEPVPYRP